MRAGQSRTLLNFKEAAEERERMNQQKCVTDSIQDVDYYLGFVRRNFDNLLKNDGDFMLRKDFYDGKVVIALDVLHNGKPKHFVVNKDNDGYFFGTHHKDTLKALIEWHMKSQTPVSEKSGCKLLTPIKRPYYLLQHNSFKLVKMLNDGSFGGVYLSDFKDNGGIGKVAVKTCSPDSFEVYSKFMREVKRMKEFNHKKWVFCDEFYINNFNGFCSIVEFYGIAVHEGPLLLAMEFCRHGSLLNYLRKKDGQLPQETYLRFCIEAAEALNYLHKQDLLHGHICAKHFLVAAEKVLKLCDFNLTDTVGNIKIEELFKQEIYSDGKKPYPGYSGLEFRTKVLNNNCQQLQMPEKTPIAVKLLVEKCWLETPLVRPDISTILKILKDIEMRTPKSDTSIQSEESDEDDSEGSADSYDEGNTDHPQSEPSLTFFLYYII
uniref:Tyrosine-protein kinase n=1 Tax=Panagrolaimus davidi TaxID=227884 RepID=A0A914QNJ3_9BILA